MADNSLSDYYGVVPGVPTSGEISLADFYGKSGSPASEYTIAAATGGTITTSGDFKIHKFTSSGTFSVSTAGTMDYVLVAGGAGAGARHCGGGGAGGVVLQRFKSVGTGSYSITIGAGGAAGTRGGNCGPNGSNSSAFGNTAIGGGGPACYGANRYTGANGGCGGGAMTRENTTYSPGTGIQPSQSGDSGTYGYGENGGTNYRVGGCCAGCGGGGAGSLGRNSDGMIGGDGGVGIDVSGLFGTGVGDSGWVGGGGGGAANAHYWNVYGRGGQGGGGHGGNQSNHGQSGTANTGGGGGGNRDDCTCNAGGSGVFIVRYKYQ
jgi:hypothetical protein